MVKNAIFEICTKGLARFVLLAVSEIVRLINNEYTFLIVSILFPKQISRSYMRHKTSQSVTFLCPRDNTQGSVDVPTKGTTELDGYYFDNNT